MSDILVISAHPSKGSFNTQIAQELTRAMQKEGFSVHLLSLIELDFDPILRSGFSGKQELEPDLLEARRLFESAVHIVWVYPTWWGQWPALLKGFIDRVFLPGWAFKNKGGALPEGLLKGRSARIVSTMDSPWWWYRLAHGRAGHRSLENATLNYVGIKDVTESTLYRTKERSDEQRQRWLKKVCVEVIHDARRALKKRSQRKTSMLTSG